jgi:hypothetical protein
LLALVTAEMHHRHLQHWSYWTVHRTALGGMSALTSGHGWPHYTFPVYFETHSASSSRLQQGSKRWSRSRGDPRYVEVQAAGATETSRVMAWLLLS